MTLISRIAAWFAPLPAPVLAPLLAVLLAVLATLAVAQLLLRRLFIRPALDLVRYAEAAVGDGFFVSHRG